MNATIADGLSARLGPRTGLTASIISPGGLPYTTGLILDLDGDKAGALGSNVATWMDQSGQGNNATQSVMVNQPIVTTGANGHNGVLFNGISSFMATANIVPTLSGTMFAVFSASVDPSAFKRVIEVGANSNLAITAGSNPDTVFAGFGNVQCAEVGISLNQFYLVSAVMTPTTGIAFLNGTSFGSATPVTVSTSPTPISIGQFGGGGFFWPGTMLRLLYFESSLSNSARQINENYLKYRYSL